MEMNNDSDTSKYNYIHNDDIDGNHNDCQWNMPAWALKMLTVFLFLDNDR